MLDKFYHLNNKDKTNKIAQIFTLDLIIASGLFVIIIISTGYLWHNAIEKISISNTRNDMEIIARNAISTLILNEGSPHNWSFDNLNNSNINSFGLANSFVSLNSKKIDHLYQNNYSLSKKHLGILGPGYEFRMKFESWNGSDYKPHKIIGIEPDNTAFETVAIQLPIMIDNSRAKIIFKLWKSCGDITC